MGYWILGGLGFLLFIFAMFLKNKEVWANIGGGAILEEAIPTIQDNKFPDNIGKKFYIGKEFKYNYGSTEINDIVNFFGEIKNDSNKNYGHVTFDVSIYNKKDVLIGTGFIVIMNFMANQIRPYNTNTILALSEAQNIGGVKIQYNMSG